MAWYDYIDMGIPPVFNPKVTPDPVAADRLEEKLQQAVRKFRPLYFQQVTQRVPLIPPLIETVAKRIGQTS